MLFHSYRDPIIFFLLFYGVAFIVLAVAVYLYIAKKVISYLERKDLLIKKNKDVKESKKGKSRFDIFMIWFHCWMFLSLIIYWIVWMVFNP